MLTRLSLTVGLSFGLALSAAQAQDEPPEVSGGFPQTELINTHLAQAWADNEIQPSPKADDLTFLRRVFLDLIGRIPTLEEVYDFEQDRGADKRARLVHRLLYESRYRPTYGGQPIITNGKRGAEAQYLEFDYTEEHAEHFANVWSVWLLTRTTPEVFRQQMHLWLTEQFQENIPYDQLVRELLTASGRSNDNGAVNFVVAHLGEMVNGDNRNQEGYYDAVPITSRVTRLFLGVQTQCTQCHDHPFNPDWEQDSFWGVNAFFRQVNRNPPVMNNNQDAVAVVELSDDPSVNRTATIFFERRSGVLDQAKARFLRDLTADPLDPTLPDKSVPLLSKKSRRELLADFVLEHDNFSKAYVNRLWGMLFGRGLNELPAVDDFGEHNPVVHEQLLDELALAFAQYDHDTKALLEWMCNSEAYQLDYVALKGVNDMVEAEPFFPRMKLKAMTPEQIFDSLMTAMGAYRDSDRQARQEARENWMSKLVQNFGDDEGNEASFNGTVIQALLMMNGPELNGELTRDADRHPVASAIDRGLNLRTNNLREKEQLMVDTLYVAALGRHVGTRPSYAFGTGRVRAQTELAMVLTELEEAKAIALSDPQQAQQIAQDPKGFYRDFFEDLYWALLNTNEFILNH